MKTRLPLNEQILYGYWESDSFFTRGKTISWVGIRGVCDKENCTNTDEHYTFDGQIFYQRKAKNETI